MSATEKEVLGYECRHVITVPSVVNDIDELTYVKQITHYTDGTKEPSVRLLKNYKRSFYITKEPFRSNKDKKEAEKLNKLQVYTSTERQMPLRIARLLGRNLSNLRLRTLARSPYLYGSDISTATLIKDKYLKQFPDLTSESRVAVFDIETDVVNGTEEILMASVTSKSNAFIAITKTFLGTTPEPEKKIRAAFTKYLGKYKEKRNIKLEIRIVDTPAQVVVECMNAAHEWKPDWMAVWNINFDLPKAFAALEKEGYNVADVFCDPCVPAEFRYAKYRPGPNQKVTASGKSMALSPHEQWHIFDVPSSFFWIDAMVVYAMIRKANGQEPSYRLDYILDKELGIRKLNFEEAEGLSKIEWHQFMQKHHKIEYCIYNLFDDISVEELDEHTKDLCITLPELCGSTKYSDFNSTPKQLADDLHFYYEQNGMIIGTLSDQMRDELDELVIGMDGWPITLPTHQVVNNGIACLKEFPHIRSMIRGHVADLDVKSSYPYTEIFLNISKATTMLELCSIDGVTEEVRRRIGLNLTGGATNAAEFCIKAYKAPTFPTLLEAYHKQRAAA